MLAQHHIPSSCYCARPRWTRGGGGGPPAPEGTSKEQVRYIHASHHKWGGGQGRGHAPRIPLHPG